MNLRAILILYKIIPEATLEAKFSGSMKLG